jgi:hypothetical protein
MVEVIEKLLIRLKTGIAVGRKPDISPIFLKNSNGESVNCGDASGGQISDKPHKNHSKKAVNREFGCGEWVGRTDGCLKPPFSGLLPISL